MKGKSTCYMHGGKSPGAPGNRNNWRHGGRSAETVALRREANALARMARETISKLVPSAETDEDRRGRSFPTPKR